MRVISGYLKGRKLEGYMVETTRPTMDRVKESMFASIQNDINNSVVLDLFCGTGSLGIEAISMGANKCYFVDNNKNIIYYLNKNISNLNINDKCVVLGKDYRQALLYLKNNNIKFNIIIVDAPYKMEVMKEIICLVNDYEILSDNGLLVLEYSFDVLDESYDNLKLIKSKKYNDKFVSIYRKVIDK